MFNLNFILKMMEISEGFQAQITNQDAKIKKKKASYFVKCCEIQFQLHHFRTETCQITCFLKPWSLHL